MCILISYYRNEIVKNACSYVIAMEKTTTHMAVVLALAFGLILGSIGSASLVHAQQQQANITGGNMTSKSTGPGAAGNVTNPTNTTKSPSVVGGGNMTSPTNAKAANQTASMQSGGNNSMAGGTNASSGNVTKSGNQTNSTGSMLSKIPVIGPTLGKILGGK
jgi:hypothetical protein